MAARRVKPEEARDHEQRAWQLRCRGWTQSRIAAELGVEQASVSRILARVSARVVAELKDSVEAYKAEQHEQLAFIASEALEAWERSKRDGSRTVRETIEQGGTAEPNGTGVNPSRVTRTIDRRDGNVAYLEEARAALAEIRKIWGIDAPTQVEHSGTVGVSVVGGIDLAAVVGQKPGLHERQSLN